MKTDDLARRALPCPFCGERLVVKHDHHGGWVAHESEPGRCIVSTMQIMDEDDLSGWNARSPAPALTDDELRERLFEIGQPSLREWCRVHSVNSAHASEFATSVRGPGADLLRALGFRRVWAQTHPPGADAGAGRG